MANLKWKTRGNSSTQGKPRVYFCCHNEDFEKFFESISNEILSLQNCSVWYKDNGNYTTEELLADFKEMQLFVMPVTTNLLCTENDALDIEFKFAIENHIPVLPLMQEPGLEQVFNQKCGDLQFLDNHNTDITAISYKEKLKKYLESVLIGDEMADKIRAAFDAYVFLSYRKKDRKYAQELMHLIHKNEFCRDIAIWYDEFLTPGENFNDSIKEALQKSGLFVLTVTPNLVNEPNYIMTTEYPMAKQEEKTILPVELVSTDREELSKKYKDIPTIADAHNDSELSDALLESIKKMAIKENDKNPEHNFFIGLAYLMGIDVEVDYNRAITLITSAAESGLPEAIRKLVNIYHEGIGVKKDCLTAIQWQLKLLTNKVDYDEKASDVFYLGKLYQEVGQFDNAETWYIAIRSLRVTTIYNLYYYAMATYELGNIYLNKIYEIPDSEVHNEKQSQKTYQEVEKMFTECIQALKKVHESNIDSFQFNIYDVYFGFARLFFEQSNYKKSRIYLTEVLHRCDSANNDDESQAKMAIDAHLLSGDIFMKQQNTDAALKEYKVVLYKIKEFDDVINKTLCMTYEGHYYQKCAELYYKCNELDEAIKFAESSIEIRKVVAEENPFCYHLSLLSESYDLLSKIYNDKKESDKSAEYAMRAFFASFESIKQNDGSQTKISNDNVQQINSFIELAESGKIDKQYEGSPLKEKQLKYKKWLENKMSLCKQGDDISGQVALTILCYKGIAGLYFENNNYIESVNTCLKLIDKLEKYYKKNFDESIIGMLANCYSSVGILYSKMYKMSTALDYSIKAMKLIEPLQRRYEKALKEYEGESSLIAKKSAVEEIESVAEIGFFGAIEFMVQYYTNDAVGIEPQNLIYWKSILLQRYAINCSLEKTTDDILKYEKLTKEMIRDYLIDKNHDPAYIVCKQYMEIIEHLTGEQLVYHSKLLMFEILKDLKENI